jgi:perosamine synthetase
MYAVRTAAAFGCDSHALRIRLAQRGIETRSFFVPMHLQPIYADRFVGQRFPIAEELCRSGLYLPTHENLDEKDVEWIAQQIEDIQRMASG